MARFPDEHESTRQQILHATCKMYVRYLIETEPLLRHCLNMASKDPSVDIRDRARIYGAIFAKTDSSEEEKKDAYPRLKKILSDKLLFCEKPILRLPSLAQSTCPHQLGSLSQFVEHIANGCRVTETPKRSAAVVRERSNVRHGRWWYRRCWWYDYVQVEEEQPRILLELGRRFGFEFGFGFGFEIRIRTLPRTIPTTRIRTRTILTTRTPTKVRAMIRRRRRRRRRIATIPGMTTKKKKKKEKEEAAALPSSNAAVEEKEVKEVEEHQKKEPENIKRRTSAGSEGRNEKER